LAIDDALEKAIGNLNLEGEIRFQNETLQAVIAGLPYIGGAVCTLFAGQARKRLVDRIVQFFGLVRVQLNKIEESRIDRSFFESEEFQTILATILQQLQTTHDKQKMKMLACALVNCGTVEHRSDDRRELFVRALRELTTQHVITLATIRTGTHVKGNWFDWRDEVCNPSNEKLLLLSDLVRVGFVQEFAKRQDLDHRHTGTYPEELAAKLEELTSHVIEGVPVRCFRPTDLGRDFLKFIGQTTPETSI
jgi:hypothetical protein